MRARWCGSSRMSPTQRTSSTWIRPVTASLSRGGAHHGARSPRTSATVSGFSSSQPCSSVSARSTRPCCRSSRSASASSPPSSGAMGSSRKRGTSASRTRLSMWSSRTLLSPMAATSATSSTTRRAFCGSESHSPSRCEGAADPSRSRISAFGPRRRQRASCRRAVTSRGAASRGAAGRCARRRGSRRESRPPHRRARAAEAPRRRRAARARRAPRVPTTSASRKRARGNARCQVVVGNLYRSGRGVRARSGRGGALVPQGRRAGIGRRPVRARPAPRVGARRAARSRRGARAGTARPRRRVTRAPRTRSATRSRTAPPVPPIRCSRPSGIARPPTRTCRSPSTTSAACISPGRGVFKDTAKGQALLQKAADAGEPNAMVYVAAMYEKGEKPRPSRIRWRR